MRNLSVGCTGSDVRDLQSSLNRRSPSDLPALAVDGIFGPKTLARVKEFQDENDLAADGIVGPKTRAALGGANFNFSTRRCNCCNGESAAAGKTGAIAAQFQSNPPPAGSQFAFVPVSARGLSSSSGFSGVGAGGASSSASSLTGSGASIAAAVASGLVRSLDTTQQATATAVYGASLDFSTIFISDQTGIGGRPFTVAVPLQGNTVQVMNCGTFSPGKKTLIHELGHVWQSQHHSNKLLYMANAVQSQATAVAANLAEVRNDPFIALNKDFPTFFPFDAYAYNPSVAFSNLAAEQMASAIENGEAAIVAHVKGVGANVVDPSCVSALSSARIADHRVAGVK